MACDRDLREVGRVASSLSSFGRRQGSSFMKPSARQTLRQELSRRRSLSTLNCLLESAARRHLSNQSSVPKATATTKMHQSIWNPAYHIATLYRRLAKIPDTPTIVMIGEVASSIQKAHPIENGSHMVLYAIYPCFLPITNSLSSQEMIMIRESPFRYASFSCFAKINVSRVELNDCM